jgi:hypothetical protein
VPNLDDHPAEGNNDPTGFVPRSQSEAQVLTNWHRAGWGALGGLLPFMLRLSGQRQVYEILTTLGWPGMVDLCFPALLSIGVAAIVTLLFKDESNIPKLVMLGISAPALITTWQGYNLAGETAERLSHGQQMQQNLAVPDAAKPNHIGIMNQWEVFSIPTVEAAETQPTQTKTFQRYNPDTLERVTASVTGGLTPNKNYFVILSSTLSVNEAEKQKIAGAAKFPGEEVDIYQSPDGVTPKLYCVVLDPNQSFDDAKRLLGRAVLSGFVSSYIWTFDFPLHPTSNLTEASAASLILSRIDIKHDGAPGSTTWKFDVIVNGIKVGSIPEHKFNKDEKWTAPAGTDAIVWRKIVIPGTGKLAIQILGYRPHSIDPARGASDVVMGSEERMAVHIDVKNKVPLLGTFTFHFFVERS